MAAYRSPRAFVREITVASRDVFPAQVEALLEQAARAEKARVLLEQTQPQVDISLGVGAEPVAEGVFEVTVTATVTGGEGISFDCSTGNVRVNLVEPSPSVACAPLTAG